MIDIGSKTKYPGNELSNFARHPFPVDGVWCESMEGFLQSLKTSNEDTQLHIRILAGYEAKKAGSRYHTWKMHQKLYWRGKEIDRQSQEYQDLLDKAYEGLYKNTGFIKALEASGTEVLDHSIGKGNAYDTVLTIGEFLSRLNSLREFGEL